MQLIDLYRFLTGQILSNLSQWRIGAALRGVLPGFSTKLSTDFVGDLVNAQGATGGLCQGHIACRRSKEGCVRGP